MTDNSILPNIEKLRNFDLNLLLIFEAVYIYNSVSLAAEKLRSSPSKISQSLNKLRDHFADPLFVRQGQGLVPTTIAVNLHTKINGALDKLLNSIVDFSTPVTKMKFVVYSSPYLALRMLPDLYKKIEDVDFQCEIQHINAEASLNSGEDILAFRKADLVFDTVPHYNYSTITSLCKQEDVIAVCRTDHPRLGTTLTRELMDEERCTYLNVNTEGLLRIQQTLEINFGTRRFAFTSGSVLLNSAISEKSDCISFVPTWFVDKFSGCLNIKRLTCNFEIAPTSIYMSYNKSSLMNKSFVNFIKLLEDSIKS